MGRRDRSSPPAGSVPWWARRVAGIPVWGCGVMFVGFFALLTVLAQSAGEGPDEGPTSATSARPLPSVVELSPAPELTEQTLATTATTTSTPTTTSTTSITTSTTTSTTGPPSTTTTTARATTTTVTVPRTTAAAGPTTSFPQTVTVRSDDGATLTVAARRDACRGGSDCLVVAFTIDGFAPRPAEFVCEFASGARFTFRFVGESVDPACSTGDRPDSIVVEVAGLRSPPIGNPA